MEKYAVNIETHTRDDVMKVCAILGKALKSSVQSGERHKVIIDGNFSNGKGAIVDGITAAIADGMKPYALSENSIYEDETCDAHGQSLAKDFNSGLKAITNTMYHFDHNAMPVEDPVGGKPVLGGIDFETYLCMLAEAPPSLRIHFKYGKDSPAQEWSRNWQIDVTDPSLQTKDMAEAIRNLHNFNEQRQARVLSGERTAMPITKI